MPGKKNFPETFLSPLKSPASEGETFLKARLLVRRWGKLWSLEEEGGNSLTLLV